MSAWKTTLASFCWSRTAGGCDRPGLRLKVAEDHVLQWLVDGGPPVDLGAELARTESCVLGRLANGAFPVHPAFGRAVRIVDVTALGVVDPGGQRIVIERHQGAKSALFDFGEDGVVARERGRDWQRL